MWQKGQQKACVSLKFSSHLEKQFLNKNRNKKYNLGDLAKLNDKRNKVKATYRIKCGRFHLACHCSSPYKSIQL